MPPPPKPVLPAEGSPAEARSEAAIATAERLIARSALTRRRVTGNPVEDAITGGWSSGRRDGR